MEGGGGGGVTIMTLNMHRARVECLPGYPRYTERETAPGEPGAVCICSIGSALTPIKHFVR